MHRVDGALPTCPDERSRLSARVKFCATRCSNERLPTESRFYGVRNGRHSPVVTSVTTWHAVPTRLGRFTVPLPRRARRWFYVCWYCTATQEIVQLPPVPLVGQSTRELPPLVLNVNQEGAADVTGSHGITGNPGTTGPTDAG